MAMLRGNLDDLSLSNEGNLKEMHFFDKHQAQGLTIDEKTLARWKIEAKSDEGKVSILRPILFFYPEQPKITMGKLKEYFTIQALTALQVDGFINVD
jgi:hypothetical protein